MANKVHHPRIGKMIQSFMPPATEGIHSVNHIFAEH
jgi:hypothetical protein